MTKKTPLPQQNPDTTRSKKKGNSATTTKSGNGATTTKSKIQKKEEPVQNADKAKSQPIHTKKRDEKVRNAAQNNAIKQQTTAQQNKKEKETPVANLRGSKNTVETLSKLLTNPDNKGKIAPKNKMEKALDEFTNSFDSPTNNKHQMAKLGEKKVEQETNNVAPVKQKDIVPNKQNFESGDMVIANERKQIVKPKQQQKTQKKR